jgi:hypothetical protein
MADTKGVDVLTMEGSFTRQVQLLSVVGKAQCHGHYWNKGPCKVELRVDSILVKPMAKGFIVCKDSSNGHKSLQ